MRRWTEWARASADERVSTIGLGARRPRGSAPVIDLSTRLAVLAAALVLDRLVGDPPWLWRRFPHPVVWMGRLIAWADARLNDERLGAAARRRRGVLAIVVLVSLALASGLVLAAMFSALPFGRVPEAALVSVLLAQGSLVDHVRAVASGLRDRGVPGGRAAVALIVGRDVSVLDGSGVSRAAIESAAENFADGVVTPAVWYLLLGLPGLLAFKLVNTADSMIGHLSPRHAAFGWAAARLDDLLNYLPARISALLISVAACGVGRAPVRAARTAWRDAGLHRSPNAGWPEAAAAGALGVALGGPRRYGTSEVDGAWLGGEGRRDADAEDVGTAVRLIDAAWGVGLAMLLAALVMSSWPR